jgi:hypothetical protein
LVGCWKAVWEAYRFLLVVANLSTFSTRC